MYQPYPGGAEPPEPSAVSAPPSIVMAARAMYAGAIASLIGIAADLTATSALRSQLLKQNSKLTPSQLTTETHTLIGVLIVASLITAGIWAWMAWACKSGKGWARLVATALFAVNTLSVLGGLLGGAVPGSAASHGYGVLVWLIGLAALVLLWRRSSTDFFRGAARR